MQCPCRSTWQQMPIWSFRNCTNFIAHLPNLQQLFTSSSFVCHSPVPLLLFLMFSFCPILLIMIHRGHQPFVPSIVANFISSEREILEHAATTNSSCCGTRTHGRTQLVLYFFIAFLQRVRKRASVFLDRAQMKHGTAAGVQTKEVSLPYVNLTKPQGQFESSKSLN